VEETKDGFVLDCSVTMAWCFDDEATAYTQGVRDQLVAVRAVVPSLWSLEVVNATIVAELKRRIDPARGGRFLTLLAALPIVVDGETSGRAFHDTAHLARAHNLSSYEAAYLELAVRRGLPLACLDGNLKAAAASVGVPIHII
jgi:predicted nucleic acid-binding protein